MAVWLESAGDRYKPSGQDIAVRTGGKSVMTGLIPDVAVEEVRWPNGNALLIVGGRLHELKIAYDEQTGQVFPLIGMDVLAKAEDAVFIGPTGKKPGEMGGLFISNGGHVLPMDSADEQLR